MWRKREFLEKSGLFQAGSSSFGRRWGAGVYSDYITSADQVIPDCLSKGHISRKLKLQLNLSLPMEGLAPVLHLGPILTF